MNKKIKVMIGDSLTTDNLLSILKAMTKIATIDQSENYSLYMEEVLQRLKDNEKSKDWIEEQIAKLKRT
jgi:hypothetical protein